MRFLVLLWMSLNEFLVEAAGIEPASYSRLYAGFRSFFNFCRKFVALFIQRGNYGNNLLM